MWPDRVKVQYSAGRGKSGRLAAYIRPAGYCFNRSRRISAANMDELNEKIEQLINRHFPTVNYYEVDGFVIGAKDKEFALKEYWRVCDREKIKKHFEVKLIEYPYPTRDDDTTN